MVLWGVSGDKPLVGDYDGDDKTDIANTLLVDKGKRPSGASIR